MRYNLCEGSSISIINGQCMILSKQGDVAVLNKTGQYIVSKLLEGVCLDESISLMSEKYRIDVVVAKENVVRLVKDLEEKNFLRKCEDL